MKTEHFSDRLFGKVQAKESVVVVGLDPDLSLIPCTYFPDPIPSVNVREVMAHGVKKFCCDIVEAVADVAVAVKPQLAYFERLGPPGLAAYEEVIRVAADQDLLVITDGKRNDISSTARQYATAYLGLSQEDDAGFHPVDSEGPKADALTVNPYLGADGVEPFLDPTNKKGIFVLVKTSNPSSGQLQDLHLVPPEGHRERSVTVADTVARWIEDYAADSAGEFGYGIVGAVVGATYPDELAIMRQAMPHVPLLIPGYGAQGGKADDVAAGFDEKGFGAVVNASRSILYAYKSHEEKSVTQAARDAAIRMRDNLRRVLAKKEASKKG